jgi:hypothetical protein
MIRYETMRRRGGRIGKEASLIRTGISGSWATSRRCVVVETSGHGYDEIPAAAHRPEDRIRMSAETGRLERRLVKELSPSLD